MAVVDTSSSDLWHLLEERAKRTPAADALVDRVGRRVTFEELREGSASLAAGLNRVGVTAGATVAWELPTCIEAVELSLALARLEVTQVPIIAIYREREVSHCCRETGASWLFTGGAFRGYDFASMGDSVAKSLDIEHLSLTATSLSRGDASELPGRAAPSGEARWVF